MSTYVVPQALADVLEGLCCGVDTHGRYGHAYTLPHYLSDDQGALTHPLVGASNLSQSMHAYLLRFVTQADPFPGCPPHNRYTLHAGIYQAQKLAYVSQLYSECPGDT